MEGELMSLDSNVPSAGIGRRTFVKWAAAAASIAAAGGLVESTRALADEPASEVATEPMTGEWKNAACWFDCGGNCVNQAYVEDGIVLATTPTTRPSSAAATAAAPCASWSLAKTV